jgi:hypothetical protein
MYIVSGDCNPKAKFWEDSDLLAGSALTLKQRQQLKEEKFMPLY